MSYLIKRDYFASITEKDLDTLLEQVAESQENPQTPDKVRAENELNVQDMVKTMITQRYDTDSIFRDVLAFNLTTAFQVGDVVQYTETAYDNNTTYILGALVSHKYLKDQGAGQVQADDIFENTTAVTSAEDFDISKWLLKTENGSIYTTVQKSTANALLPEFSYTANAFTGNHDLILGWEKGDDIFFERDGLQVKLYFSSADRTAGVDSVGIVDFDPVAKIFPDNRPIERGDDIENTVSGDLSFIGVVPDTTTWSVVGSRFFIKEDDRNRTLRYIIIQLAIFELHKLINPRNIPDLRLEAKDDAMRLLNKISKGEVTADLPIYFDDQRGQNITFNSVPKRGDFSF